jgi:glucokinase
MSKKLFAGFDLGGKNCRAVIANEEGKFLCKPSAEDVDKGDGPKHVSFQMLELLERCAYESSVNLRDIVSVGISSAGPLDLRKFGGSIVNSTNIKYNGVKRNSEYWEYGGESLIEKDNEKEKVIIPLVNPIRDILDREVYLGNDVNTAVIGVVAFGEGRKYGNPDEIDYTAAITTHGAGFGGGVWTRGGVLEGVDGNAVEIGHLKVIEGENARECGCGNYGCAETFGSGTGITSNAIAKIKEYGLNQVRADAGIYRKAKEKFDIFRNNKRDVENFTLKNVEDYIDSKLVFDVYRETGGRDRVAREVIEEAGKYIGRTYGMISTFYNPHFIATFGSITKNWDILEEMVFSEMKNCSFSGKMPKVFLTELRGNVGLYGAIGRAMEYGK